MACAGTFHETIIIHGAQNNKIAKRYEVKMCHPPSGLVKSPIG
jgi:hypothetical protein